MSNFNQSCNSWDEAPTPRYSVVKLIVPPERIILPYFPNIKHMVGQKTKTQKR